LIAAVLAFPSLVERPRPLDTPTIPPEGLAAVTDGIGSWTKEREE